MNEERSIPLYFIATVKILWRILTVSLILTSVVCAADPTELVQHKLAAIQRMSAAFSQTVSAKHKLIAQSSGTMALVRPHRFRWQTKQPLAQTVVADGQHVWIYDVELEQVTVSKQTDRLGAAGALFLSQDEHAVARDFVVAHRLKGDLDIFELHARSEKANFENVRLIFQGMILQGIDLDDQLGQHTKVRFSKILVNQPVADSLFKLHIPAGVDVVRQ